MCCFVSGLLAISKEQVPTALATHSLSSACLPLLTALGPPLSHHLLHTHSSGFKTVQTLKIDPVV